MQKIKKKSVLISTQNTKKSYYEKRVERSNSAPSTSTDTGHRWCEPCPFVQAYADLAKSVPPGQSALGCQFATSGKKEINKECVVSSFRQPPVSFFFFCIPHTKKRNFLKNTYIPKLGKKSEKISQRIHEKKYIQNPAATQQPSKMCWSPPPRSHLIATILLLGFFFVHSFVGTHIFQTSIFLATIFLRK
jgi:hypothetical protein